MNFIKKITITLFTALIFFKFSFKAEEEEIMIQAISDQIQALTKDLKTLKKQFIKNQMLYLHLYQFNLVSLMKIF